ncbi:MAG: hypothetical protein IJD18_01670 [Clostridia bacterium]|nr:hypothetical protein [Clostridia bacterium]
MNEQTYLDTVCKRRCPKPPKHVPPPNGLNCSLTTPKGTISFYCNDYSQGISIDWKNHC